MLCQNPTCLKPIDDDATFCVHCGASQNDEQPTVIKSFGSAASPTEVLPNYKSIKICPTCKKQFADDYAFCLDDGTTLVAIAAPIAPTQRFEFCGGCGAPMSNDYAFCKNCGTPRSRSAEPNFVPVVPPPPPPKISRRWFGPVIPAPPSTEIRRSWFDENKTLVAVLACAAIFLLIGGGLFFALLSNDRVASVNNSNSNVSRFANNSSRTATPANTNTSVNTTPLPPATVQAGQTGRLLTDLNIRDEPNKLAASKGIHFRGAKVRILDSTSYETPEGEMSTWYRVRVFEYGCSADTSLGCGKNSPGDSDEGWMNGRYISVD